MSTHTNNAAVGPRAMDLEWNDLGVILAICRAGSLSGAARMLGHNHSTIFRKINAIEDKTGVRFFERLPDGYAMTEAGQIAMRYAERVENEVHALGREVMGQDMRLQGKIRVTAPEGIATMLAPEILARFCRRHPDVSIELSGGSAAMDLVRREADVAIRATKKPPDTSLGRKICDFRVGVYASPQYLQQHPERSLRDQNWCLIQGTVNWLVPHVWKKKQHGEQQTVFTSSTSLAVIHAAAAGMGVTMMPCYLGDADNRLVRVGELIEPLTMELWVLTHPDLRHTARVKALIAYLHESLTKQSALFEGNLQ